MRKMLASRPLLISMLIPVLIALPGFLSAGPVEAVHPGRVTLKSMAPLGIAVEHPSDVVPGEPFAISLRLRAPLALERVRIALDADEPLVLLEPVGDLQIESLAPGEAATATVDVLPLEPGRHYLRVYVTADSDRGPIARPLVIPVVAGSRSAASSAAPSAGRRVSVYAVDRPTKARAAPPPLADTPAGLLERETAPAAVRSMPARETVH